MAELWTTWKGRTLLSLLCISCVPWESALSIADAQRMLFDCTQAGFAFLWLQQPEVQKHMLLFGPQNSVMDKDPNCLVIFWRGAGGVWTALGASFLQPQPGPQPYFSVFKVDDKASSIPSLPSHVAKNWRRKHTLCLSNRVYGQSNLQQDLLAHLLLPRSAFLAENHPYWLSLSILGLYGQSIPTKENIGISVWFVLKKWIWNIYKWVEYHTVESLRAWLWTQTHLQLNTNHAASQICVNLGKLVNVAVSVSSLVKWV